MYKSFHNISYVELFSGFEMDLNKIETVYLASGALL